MWHTMDINEVLHKLKTNPEMGLNEKEVEKRQEIQCPADHPDDTIGKCSKDQTNRGDLSGYKL